MQILQASSPRSALHGYIGIAIETERAMASPLLPPVVVDPTLRAGLRRDASNLLRRGMEAGLLVLVCLAPWAFGAAGPEFEFILYAGVAGLLVAWGARMVVAG